MATNKKIARSAKRTKLTTEKPVDKAATAVIPPNVLERLDGLLARAQREAIEAAPRRVPLIGGGEAAAIRAYDTIRHVRAGLAELAAEGGAS